MFNDDFIIVLLPTENEWNKLNEKHRENHLNLRQFSIDLRSNAGKWRKTQIIILFFNYNYKSY